MRGNWSPTVNKRLIDATTGACFRSGEIRILDSRGAVERIIPFSDSAICITIFILPSWRDFWQKVWKPRSESERGRFSRQLLSLVQTSSHTINQSGERKDLSYENKNYTHRKFDEPLTFAARFGVHRARACSGR